MARYEQGETLSSIARTYDCSPPAISYIVSRNREKAANEQPQGPAAEPQLVKAHADGTTENGSAEVETTEPAAVAVTVASRDMEPADGGAANGEPRRTLHLALGNGNGSHAAAKGTGNGNGHVAEPPARPGFAGQRPPQPQPQPQGAASGNGQRPIQPPHNPPSFDAGRNGRDLFAVTENRPPAQQPRDTDGGRRDAAAFIDEELRRRVDGDITAFLAAFDAALASDTHESRFGLREATDRLLRAGARTRIELERLEARVPLPPPEGARSDPAPAAWRYR